MRLTLHFGQFDSHYNDSRYGKQFTASLVNDISQVKSLVLLFSGYLQQSPYV
jgi:hypothetical protein